MLKPLIPRRKCPKNAGRDACLRALVAERTKEGYMAEIADGKEGACLLIENHCPICDAASECQAPGAMEIEVFREVVGTGVEIERTGHIPAGARRCAYRVCAKE